MDAGFECEVSSTLRPVANLMHKSCCLTGVKGQRTHPIACSHPNFPQEALVEIVTK